MLLFCRPVGGEKRQKMESHSWLSEAEQQFSVSAPGLHSPAAKLLSELLQQKKTHDI